MKRSRALEKIKSFLQTLSLKENGTYYSEDAETILNFIEDEIKMSPPNVAYDEDGIWNHEKFVAHVYSHTDPNYWED